MATQFRRSVGIFTSVGLLVAASSWMSPCIGESGEHEGHQSKASGAAEGGAPVSVVQEAPGKGDQGMMRCGGEGHEHHKAMMEQKGYKRSERDYALVDVPLIDKDGDKTTLVAELDSGKPVIITFIFTTCTTICPVLSGTFAQLQAELGDELENLKMISVSIDPEYDTPERLRAYAGLFSAGPQWQFLTGTLDDSVAVQKSFDVYRGNKMNHEPTILLRKAPGTPWIRLDGLASAADVAEEYRRMMAAN